MSGQSERALLHEQIMADFEQRVKMFLAYAEAHSDLPLAELETKARDLSRDSLGMALQAVVEQRERPVYENPSCSCGRRMQYKGQQSRQQQTLAGMIRWRRSYYYCAHCHRGCYPLDEALEIAPGQFSEAHQSGMARLGATLPFRQAADTFTALTGVRVSGREVARTTEERGAKLEAWRRQEGEGYLSGQLPDASGRGEASGCWMVSLDAAKVRFQDGWHEVKAGVVAVAQQERSPQGEVRIRARGQSYLAEAGDMERAGERLYAEAVRRGIDPAVDTVSCLADGAPANWVQFGLHFAHRAEVLDWYHACQHLWAAGKGLYGEGTEEASAWVAKRKAELWAGNTQLVLNNLHQAAQGDRGEAARDETHYFETNEQRMAYATFRERGYPIGSGTVESACKRVVIGRARQSGMRWRQQGAQSVLSLRAELLSDRWDQAWSCTRSLPKVA